MGNTTTKGVLARSNTIMDHSTTVLFAIHAAVTWTLVGLVWTIQLVNYPLFNEVGTDTFSGYHSNHLWRITLVVGPLAVLEFATAVLLLRAGALNPWLIASFVPMVLNWLTTFLVQVPLHLRLSRKFETEVLRKLITCNWWRTSGWSIRGLCLLLAFAPLD